MTKGKLLAVVVVWLIVFGIGAATWRFVVRPHQKQTEEQEQLESLKNGSSDSRYKYQLNFALDSFSGYAILRSEEFREQLAKRGIKINFQDDKANYRQRLQSLDKGDVQMAAFTIDALVKASAQLGDLPASIVAVVDETIGADAMVAYKDVIRNVDDLNQPDVRFVLTPDSPSETLARVVMAHFNLDRLPENPFVETRDAADAYDRYKQSKPDTPQVFVLWEPYVSKILENPDTHVVVDSKGFQGYIVDVIVVSRDYLAKNHDVVRDVVACYFRAAYKYRSDMVDLVKQDAQALKTPLTDEQAKTLVDGVWWKNTQENFAHFGMHSAASLQHIEDVISKITGVLLSTGAITADPTGGRPNLLYYDKILRELKDSDFHPGLAAEGVRDDTVDLPSLSDTQWQQLSPIGTLEVPTLVFAPGTARLTERSQRILDELVQTLNTSRFYVLIRGNASLRGNLEANKQLAEKRAQAAAEYLIGQGISRSRVRAVGREPSGETRVEFVLGQMPY